MLEQEIEIRKKARVNLREYLFEVVDSEQENLAQNTHHGYYYLAESTQNGIPVFIHSFESLTLGEQELPVRFIGHGMTVSDKELHTILQKDKFLREKVLSRHRTLMKNLPKGGGQWVSGRWVDIEAPSQQEVFDEICTKHNIGVYTKTTQVSREQLLKIPEEKLKECIDLYITGGYDIAPELFAVMRAGLIEFPADPLHHNLMKYRGHALIIKKQKSGVSSISSRIGTNINQISLSSLEGHANADGIITHSSLHNQWGHVNIDEFLEMPEHLLQHIFDFLERGVFLTKKASRTIYNRGAPRLTFTANPQDIEGADFSVEIESTKQKTDEYGQVFLEEDNEYARVMYEVFKTSLSQLTSVSGAAFSRIGIVLFAPRLLPAKATKTAHDIEVLKVCNAISESVLESIRPLCADIFRKCEEWLNQPMPEYTRKLDKLMKTCPHAELKTAWAGQKDAYRHIRGHALSEAILDHVYFLLQYEEKKIVKGEKGNEVVKNNIEVDEILESAEENLEYAVNINLSSLRNILHSVEAFEDDPQILAAEIENLKPGYLKAVLLAYTIQGLQLSLAHESILPIDSLQRCFSRIEYEKRKVALEGYSSWSRFVKKINVHKMRRVLSVLLSRDIITSSGKIRLIPSIVEKLREAFVCTRCKGIISEHGLPELAEATEKIVEDDVHTEITDRIDRVVRFFELSHECRELALRLAGVMAVDTSVRPSTLSLVCVHLASLVTGGSVSLSTIRQKYPSMGFTNPRGVKEFTLRHCKKILIDILQVEEPLSYSQLKIQLTEKEKKLLKKWKQKEKGE